MTLLWKRLVVLSIIGCLAVSLAQAEDTKFLGPSWKKEPEDLILPIHSPEQEAVLTCEASGVPSPQYRYYSERGDAVAKASKQPHVGDFRQLVHELDQHQYCELRIIVLEIRNTYAVLYDVITKNFDKIKKPRGDLSSKALIY